MSMRHILKSSAVAATLFAAAIRAFAGPVTFFGPSPYLSATDIPAGFYAGNIPTLLDTLEDGSLDASLIGSGGGAVRTNSALNDSVDADDGLIDGACTHPFGRACASWVNSTDAGNPASATFTFVGTDPLPTAFGLVWTDGKGDITFSATGADGLSLGSFDATGFADRFNSQTTAEDRFFGVQFDGGIRSITITETTLRNSGPFGGFFIELDHIQYGYMPQLANAVPEPGSWALVAVGLLGLGYRSRRKSKPAATTCPR